MCGHTRYKAAIRLGLDTVPCIVADDLTEDEIRAYRLVDNKTSEYALWDTDLLSKELCAIDFDLSSWTFDIAADFDFDVPAVPDTPEIKGMEYKEKFGVVIDCTDEQSQKNAYEYVTAGGFSARIVSI